MQLDIKTWCLGVVYLDGNAFFHVQLIILKGLNRNFFRFPKDTVRKKEWINKIPTPNLKESGKTRVCTKHVDGKDIKRSDIIIQMQKW